MIIVSYQSRDTIAQTLDVLSDARRNSTISVVVVDNASTDGTADLVSNKYPWVRLLRSECNVGFGRGCNIGLENVETPYVLLLNPDAICDLAALRIMLDFLESQQSVGIVGPAVIEASGALQPSGALPTPMAALLKPLFPGWASRGMRKVIPGEPPQKTNWICGSIMLIRSSVIKETGGFDPRFFLYFEESDLCVRAQQAGWEIWTVGEAVCKHVNAASAAKTGDAMMWGTISEHYFRSRFYYMIKHHGWLPALAMEFGEIVCMFARSALEMLRGRSYPNLSGRLHAPMFRQPATPT